MIDAKRLAELMEPGMLKALAEYLDTCVAPKIGPAKDDLLESAAAVLREVAASGETPPTCCVEDCGKGATVGPLCPDHILDFAPITCAVNGCPDAATLEDGTPLTARVAFGEVPMCLKHYELEREARKVGGGDITEHVTADTIRDGIAQAFAEMPEQIYNAISEAVFSYLRQNGVQCPKAKP